MSSSSKTSASLLLFDEEDGGCCSSVDDAELEPLSWRSDPLKTHSDWTIEIVQSSSTTTTTTSYHVHKAIMGVGRRRCKYFSTLFQTQANVLEKKHSTSRIVLAEPHASVFPLLLDFCYDLKESQKLVIDGAANAVALRNIANYFGCDELRKYVNQYIEHDIAASNLEKGPLYWTLAAMHDDSILAESARRICAEHVEELEDEDILQLPMDLFRQLVLSPHLNCHSEALGWIVADFLQRHINNITVQLVLELTNPDILPHIDHEEALVFFHVLRHLQPTPSEWVNLESLCHRCGMGLAREMEWTNWNVEEERQDLWNRWAKSMTTMKSNTYRSSTTTHEEEEKVDYSGPVTSDVNSDESFEHNFIISVERSLVAEVFILISRLTTSLLEAQRVYHSELMAEQQHLQMKNQLLEAQVVAQKQQLQQVSHRPHRKPHQEFSASCRTKPESVVALPRSSYSTYRGSGPNVMTSQQHVTVDREIRSVDQLRQIGSEVDIPTTR